MLNNVIPRWIMPFADQTAAYTEFVSSGKADEWLTPRERADCDDVMRPRWGGMHGVDDRNHGALPPPPPSSSAAARRCVLPTPVQAQVQSVSMV
eukprot:COSAG04_NODE_873_length_9707_cov_3.177248_8_plen_94_part_00